MPKVCIICQKGVSAGAVKVKEDRIIGAIRFVKKKLGVAQNNELYVCAKDLPEYEKRRKKFEKDLVVFGALGIAIVVILAGLPLLSGRFDLLSFVLALFMGALIFIFGAFFKYVPATERSLADLPAGKRMPATETAKEERKAATPKARAKR